MRGRSRRGACPCRLCAAPELRPAARAAPGSPARRTGRCRTRVPLRRPATSPSRTRCGTECSSARSFPAAGSPSAPLPTTTVRRPDAATVASLRAVGEARATTAGQPGGVDEGDEVDERREAARKHRRGHPDHRGRLRASRQQTRQLLCQRGKRPVRRSCRRGRSCQRHRPCEPAGRLVEVDQAVEARLSLAGPLREARISLPDRPDTAPE